MIEELERGKGDEKGERGRGKGWQGGWNREWNRGIEREEEEETKGRGVRGGNCNRELWMWMCAERVR